jgi:hypothetical protein
MGRARPEEQLVDQWIALEALFTRGTTSDLKNRPARIASFLTTTPEAAVALRYIVKQSYGVRSKVVHGVDLSDIDIPDTEQSTRDWLRRSLIRVLLEPNSFRAAVSSRASSRQ